ncbi:hypothetical protein B1H26_40265 [Amycolatopsis sp. BJA-103]|nr:hypothetical protein BKN51_00065 [Amycolatopsis sp. BJA-103]AUI56822.1 hypothetical protein BKN51_00395 [Amycolatopsis sp. BJA-103]PNE13465.1 hypothetical protein B1H26_40265 [Amycolatopsis sp. BJA-103]
MTGRREWTFRSEVVTPHGIRVEVAVSVPTDLAGTDVLEVAEHAQMAATRLNSTLQRAEKSGRGRVFREEIPF